MFVTSVEKDTLRSLASKYMEYALSDKNQEKRKLWTALNDMHMQKPMVFIDQIPWEEMDVDGSLVCTVKDPYFRKVEYDLRRWIYRWEHIGADMVLNPYIILSRPIINTGFGLSNVTKFEDISIKCHAYEDQLEEIEDVSKIKDPIIGIDTEKEAEILALAHDIFDGIAPIKWSGLMVHSGLWDSISCWKGVENCYFDLIDRPELIHAIMERYTNATLALIDQINKLGLQDIVSNICHCSYTFTEDPLTKNGGEEHPTTYNGWTYSMAQLFTSVSPDTNEEFDIPYMKKILSKFGAVYYGCCERLDDRLHLIDKLPNIRKISCSPWSDRENFAANLPKKYIMSNKPNPSYLLGSTFDEELIRKDLKRTIKAAKDHDLGLELLLKDLMTLNNDPKRLWRWSEIALEETINSVL